MRHLIRVIFIRSTYLELRLVLENMRRAIRKDVKLQVLMEINCAW